MTIAPLDSVSHADVRLKAVRGAQSGDPLGQIGVYAEEFVLVQREYPILFTRDEDDLLQPVAILGLAAQENLFASDRGWQARYIPALVRRGPLMIGRARPEDPAVHIDMAHARIAADGQDGYPLFLEHGGHAPALVDAVDALQLIHRGEGARAAMSEIFQRHELVKPLPISINIDDTTTIQFENFSAILPETLADLSAEALGELSSAGLLVPAIMAAHSLGNINALADRRQGRPL